jgi:methionine salvage enolase-phosphatase E1
MCGVVHRREMSHISFMADVLFLYARNNVRKHLDATDDVDL